MQRLRIPPRRIGALACLLLCFVVLASTADAENLGRGVFALEDSYRLPGPGSSLAIGDFDLDGDPDIAAALETVIVFYRNDGAGGLELWTGLAERATRLHALDVDRDGRTDLLCTSYDSSFVLRCDGAFAFEHLPQALPSLKIGRWKRIS